MHNNTPTGQVKAILDATKTQHQIIQSWKASLNTAMVQEQQKILTNLYST